VIKKTGYGDGVRHNRLGLRSSRFRLMTPTNSLRENSIVLDVLIISLGAIVGANARYFLSRLAVKQFGAIFPYGTLAINVLGSLVVGLFVIWTTERVLADPRWRLLVVVGFCGSFTTFSSYAFESMSLFDRGQWLLAAGNILSNNLLCLGAALAGMALARAL
jgi:fluoride exporter